MYRNDSNTKILSTIILVLLLSSVASLKLQQDAKVLAKVETKPDQLRIIANFSGSEMTIDQKINFLFKQSYPDQDNPTKYTHVEEDFTGLLDGQKKYIKDCTKKFSITKKETDKKTDSIFCKSYIIYHFLVLTIVCKAQKKLEGYEFKDVPITDCLRAHFTAKKWNNFNLFNKIERFGAILKISRYEFYFGDGNAGYQDTEKQDILLPDLLEYKNYAISCIYTPQKK